MATTPLFTLLDLLTTPTDQKSDTRWASHPLLLRVCHRKILQPMRRPPVLRLCRIFQEAFHIAELGAQKVSYRLLPYGSHGKWETSGSNLCVRAFRIIRRTEIRPAQAVSPGGQESVSNHFATAMACRRHSSK